MTTQTYVLLYRLAGELESHKVRFEAKDMEHAVKYGYGCAKGLHGVPVVEFSVSAQ